MRGTAIGAATMLRAGARALRDRAGHAPSAGRTSTRSTPSCARCREELAARGHRVLVLAPSRSPELVRESRRLHPRRARAPERCSTATAACACSASASCCRSRPRGAASRRRRRSTSRARSRRRSRSAPLDFVHVHEPFAPSAARVALRHSRALNVGTFHAPTERVLSTQVARRFVELFFGRLDARTASLRGHARPACSALFPARLPRAAPGRDRADAPAAARRGGAACGIAFVDREERAALRLFLRALRRLPADAEWQATVFAPSGARAAALRSRLRERVHGRLGRRRQREERARATPTSLVAASTGRRPRPGLLLRALGAGAVPVAARLPSYEEVLDDGDARPAVRARRRRDARRAARAAGRATPTLRGAAARARADGAPALAWSRVADELEAVYAGVAARRHDARGQPGAARAARRAAADRRRPAHAHRPLARLRDAGGGAAGHGRARGPRARSRSPTTTRSPARSRRARRRRVRRQGDRRRGGQDRRPGRGHRPVHRASRSRAG